MSLSSPNTAPKSPDEWFQWIARRLRILERHTHSPIAEKRLGVSSLTYGTFTTGTHSLFDVDPIYADGDVVFTIRFSCAAVSSTVAGDVLELEIRRGGFGGTVVGTCRKEVAFAGIAINGGSFEVTDQPPTGNVTYAVTAHRQSGTGSWAIYPEMTMVVERAR